VDAEEQARSIGSKEAKVMLVFLEFMLYAFIGSFILVYTTIAIWFKFLYPVEYKLAKKEIK
jgi:hypothetical protein